MAVAAVVLNRLKSLEFPDTLKEVVYQPGAFTCVDDGQINLKPGPECYEAAFDAISGNDPTGGCLFYLNPKTAASRWMLKRMARESVTVIGSHVFMK